MSGRVEAGASVDTWHLHLSGDLEHGLDADDLGVALAVTTGDGRVVSTNAALRDLLGDRYPDGPDALAGLLLAAGVAEPRTRLAASLVAAQDLVLCRGGATRTVRLISNTLPEGRVLHLVHDLHDADANRERQAELQSLIAHDLRSPLAVIQGYAGLLATGQPGPLNATQSEFLSGIDLKIVEVTRLLDDFLDLSRLEAGALQLQPEAVPLAELASRICEEQRRCAESRGISMSAHVEPEDLELTADPLRLKQVVENLVGNAVKYNGDGGWVRVEIAIVGGDVRIQVVDGGPGMDAKELAAVFEPFQRGTAGRGVSGSGLGLAVVQRLVALHGGSIAATSRPGDGTTFEVRLPRRRDTAPANR